VGVAVEGEEAAGAELLGEAGGAEVEAAAEEAPGAGDDDGADAVVRGGGVESGREVGEEVAVDGVGGRPVQGEEADAALPVFGADGGHRVGIIAGRVALEGSRLGESPPAKGRAGLGAAKRQWDGVGRSLR